MTFNDFSQNRDSAETKDRMIFRKKYFSLRYVSVFSLCLMFDLFLTCMLMYLWFYESRFVYLFFVVKSVSQNQQKGCIIEYFILLASGLSASMIFTI